MSEKDLINLINEQTITQVNEKDLAALKKLYEHLDFPYDLERIANDYDCNYLTMHQDGFVKTSGKKVEWRFWWYLDETHEAAIRTDTLDFLTEKEMEKLYLG